MISVKNVTKDFTIYKKDSGFKGAVKGLFVRKKESIRAVNNISFDVKKGEIIGYIGANGAGKSTTIKMMTGVLTPSAGEIKVAGMVPHENRIENAKHIGVVFGQRTQLWWDLPLQETFTILKEIYNVEDHAFEERYNYLKELLDLNDFIDQPVRTLSLGQRMRADLAAAMLHNPDILYLDEPTIGLDVLVKEKICYAIKELNEKYQVTVILTTHDMSDIQELATRIMIIEKGAIIYDGSKEDINKRFGNNRMLEMKLDELKTNLIQEVSLMCHRKDKKSIVLSEDNTLKVTFNQDRLAVADIIGFVMSQAKVLDFKLKDQDIEDIAKDFMQGEYMKKWLKTYFPFSKATVQAHILAYPFETFMYFFGMTVGIFVVYYIWKVIYQTGGYDLLEGFTFNEMIAYVVLSFTAMQVTDNGTVWIIADEIRSGNIIMNLIKPLNYHMRIFAEVSGVTGFLTLVMIVPVSLITIFSFKIGSIPMFVAFLLSLFLGVVISFLFDFIFGMLAFYVKNLWGIGFGKFALVRLLSGALIPLVFFPKPIQNILNLLPFKGMIYTPVMIFLGKYQSQEMLMSMMNQVLWIGILALCNYLLWRKAVTRLTVQGG